MARRIRAARLDLKVLYVTVFVDTLFEQRATLWEGEGFLDKPFTDLADHGPFWALTPRYQQPALNPSSCSPDDTSEANVEWKDVTDCDVAPSRDCTGRPVLAR